MLKVVLAGTYPAHTYEKLRKLLGAGLDGVEEEPLPGGHELLTTPGIVVTPHVGGGTADIGDVIMPMLAKDICDFAGAGDCAHVVNRKCLLKVH